MSRCVLSSVLLMTTLLQSMQLCCVHTSLSQRSFCSTASSSSCKALDGTRGCLAEVCASDASRTIDAKGHVSRRPHDSAQCAASRLTPESGSSPHLPVPERRECPTCRGELPNPVTKTGELQFVPSTDQETLRGRFPEVRQISFRIDNTPGQGSRSRIRSSGHLLI